METLKEILKAHIDYRKQLFKLAKSDIIKTYKGAALGWAWALIRPAIQILFSGLPLPSVCGTESR